jgi:hypothetical protein
MAEVYKAYQPGLDRFVAIKILHTFLADEENFLTRFQREAKAVAALRHPNIVQVFDFDYDQESNLYYMVMEYIDGPSLKARLKDLDSQGVRMSVEEAVRVATSLAEALEYAHKRGMVHRDVKPANIMFNSDGQVILTDFGIAKMVSLSGVTASGAIVGTPAYMSPEQGLGQAGDERSDIYSLGVVLYQLLTSYLPFDADTPMGVVLKHINDPLPSPRGIRSDLPEGLERVLIKTLSKDPNLRYQKAAEFAADSRRALAGETVQTPVVETMVAASSIAPTVPLRGRSPGGVDITPPSWTTPVPTPAPAPAQPSRRRWWIPVLIGGAALVVLAILGGLFLVPRLFPTDSSGEITPTTAVGPTSDATADSTAVALAVTLTALQETMGAPTPTSPATPTASPTPDLTLTAQALCVYEAELVEDVGIWPSPLAPGQSFTKRWIVRNSGTCDWLAGAQVVFISGEQMGGPSSLEAEPLAVGEEWEIELSLEAPGGDGSYAATWQLQDAEGNPLLGENLSLAVRVGPTSTPRPPTATPTPEYTPTPVRPLEMSYPSLLPGSCWSDGTAGTWGATVCWNTAYGSSAEHHYFVGFPSVDGEQPEPCHAFTTQHNATHLQIYYSTSGGNQFWLSLPAGCCSGSEGFYRTPGGEEVIWRPAHVQKSACD